MSSYWDQYIPLLFFIAVAIILGIIMLIIPFIAAKRLVYEAKNKPYECGFSQIQAPRKQFSIKFYVISILFIIFDVEIILVIPWAVHLGHMKRYDLMGGFAFWNVIFFLLILTLGLIYEWKKGALDSH